jgi:hypothetical protein
MLHLLHYLPFRELNENENTGGMWIKNDGGGEFK